jgi:predicted RNA-binding protein (virulence factor B family)
MAELGRSNDLMIVRESDNGFYLDGGDLGEILLPSREVPEDVEQGDIVDVFVARDSEDRLIATTTKPVCEVGDFAALEVTTVNPRIGAFLDWGLAKDLLLPFREQVFKVKPGQRVIVRVLLDEVSNRVVATARTNRFLNNRSPRVQPGQAVTLLIQERTPMGYMAIVDQSFRGLLHENQLHRPLQVGETLPGYVAAVKEDGKVDLSLEPVGYGRVTGLAGEILEKLKQAGGRLEIGDKSDPEDIKRTFGTSKKAFKQAAGALYRSRKVKISGDSIELV